MRLFIAGGLILFLLYMFGVLLWTVVAIQVVLVVLFLALREWGMVAIVGFATAVEVLSFM